MYVPPVLELSVEIGSELFLGAVFDETAEFDIFEEVLVLVLVFITLLASVAFEELLWELDTEGATCKTVGFFCSIFIFD
jgi:hypothetical protein